MKNNLKSSVDSITYPPFILTKMKRSFLLSTFVILATTVFGQNYNKGKYLIEIGQYSSAKKQFQEILTSNPAEASAMFYMGEIALKQGKSDSAQIWYNNGITSDAKSGLNYAGLGKLIYSSDKAKGKDYFDKALSLSKNKDVEIPSVVSEFHIEANEPEKAFPLLEKALKYNSKDPDLYLLLGDAYLAKNDGNKALENYERNALSLNSNYPKSYLKIGRLYSRTRNYDMAMQYYKNAIEKDANYSPAYKEIAEVYFKVGQYSKAIAAYEKYMGIADKDADSEFRYGSFIFLNKDYSNAIRILSKLTEKQKDNAVLFRVLGYSYFETGNFEKAFENMNTFFQKAKNDQVLASDFEYLAKIENKKGNTEAAINNMNKALEKDPSNYDLFIELGNILFLNKNFSAAAKAYEGKLSKTKGSPNDYLNYGKMLYFQEDFKKADSAFTILSEMIPNLPHGHLWKAKSNEQLDPEMKEGLAKIPYEKFTEIAEKEKEKFKSDLINAYSYLGSYYANTNETEKSATSWKKVKEMDPANKNANEALKNYK